MSFANKVAVIGLDGVPFSLLQDLFEAGVMPRLAEVAGAGSFLQMETVHAGSIFRGLGIVYDREQPR